MLFPEGGYNNTEEKLIDRLFAGPWLLAKECGTEVVPIISFNDYDSKDIYISAGRPIRLDLYEKEEARTLLRDAMATILWKLIEDYAVPLKRMEICILSGWKFESRFMNVRTGTTMCGKRNSQPTKEKSRLRRKLINL